MSAKLGQLNVLIGVVCASVCLFPAREARPAPIAQQAATTGLPRTEPARPQSRKPSARESERLQSISRLLEPGVVLLGTLDTGDDTGQLVNQRGMGFVVSTKQRLVVTAAHVADLSQEIAPMLAVVAGTRRSYPVERAWYHPRTVRRLDDRFYVRSMDPRDGEVETAGPDIAVLQLGREGPELPVELSVAGLEELEKLEGQAAGLLGCPESMDDRPLTLGGTPGLRFAGSVIGKMNCFIGSEVNSEEQRQELAYDAERGPGLSGSPIFLQNGHIVGIHRGANLDTSEGSYNKYGLRIDCLRELLVYHKLAIAINGLSIEPVIARSDWGPDPRLAAYRVAVRLVRDADSLRKSGRYRDAQMKCEEAMRIAPDYGGALLQRSKTYLYYLGAAWGELTHEQRLRYARLACQDSERCVRLDPPWHQGWLIHLQNIIFRASITSIREEFLFARDVADDFLKFDESGRPQSTADRDFTYNLARSAISSWAKWLRRRVTTTSPSDWTRISRAGTRTGPSIGTKRIGRYVPTSTDGMQERSGKEQSCRQRFIVRCPPSPRTLSRRLNRHGEVGRLS